MPDERSKVSSPFSAHISCALCHQPIVGGEAAIPTTTGGLVHIVCADRDAAIAARLRTRQVITHTGILFLIVVVCWLFGLDTFSLLLLGTGLVLAHIRWHRIWWRHVIQSIRLATTLHHQ